MSAKQAHQPISVSPTTVEFAAVRQKQYVSLTIPSVTLRVTYDGLLNSPTHPHLQGDSVLCFHVRTSHPQYIRVKG
eukprot:CAMPEP_0176474066 /NCGR_PEP_ID=MMETSP0127-20121128/42737_1 /TAXON_ID=938130 /ORGANISM="Platyophrya macrostoma, Strain WH" /LENGTH=75 /DNA_ID=CAMNT_0017869295 /DNA_START=16 /DNA_END=239 /DNA_ORIENTATION=+